MATPSHKPAFRYPVSQNSLSKVPSLLPGPHGSFSLLLSSEGGSHIGSGEGSWMELSRGD